MKILWKYLKPYKGLIILALLLALTAQLLNLIDPIIFGRIIDDYASGRGNLPENELVRGVLFWLALAIAIALLARLFRGLQEYFSRVAVARFGMDIFNEGLKQSLRLSYQEFEQSRSGETISLMQKVKTDTERFVNSLINVLFSSIIGIGFLIWYSITKSWLLIPVFLIGTRCAGCSYGFALEKDKNRAAVH